MGYRRNYRNYNNYATDGGYDSTGRWRSEAWHMDGGANDEGWHQAYCSYCGKETEHGRGSGCVPCENRMISARAKKNRNNPAKTDRQWVFKLYEEKAGSLPDFLANLKRQNEYRALSPKQIEVGKKVLAKHIDECTLRSYWVASHRK